MSNPTLEVRRTLIGNLHLDESAYPDTHKRLVARAIQIARDHPDEYSRHRVQVQLGETHVVSPSCAGADRRVELIYYFVSRDLCRTLVITPQYRPISSQTARGCRPASSGRFEGRRGLGRDDVGGRRACSEEEHPPLINDDGQRGRFLWLSNRADQRLHRIDEFLEDRSDSTQLLARLVRKRGILCHWIRVAPAANGFVSPV